MVSGDSFVCRFIIVVEENDDDSKLPFLLFLVVLFIYPNQEMNEKVCLIWGKDEKDTCITFVPVGVFCWKKCISGGKLISQEPTLSAQRTRVNITLKKKSQQKQVSI